MKKCEHFKDLILTDYIDGQLDKNTAGSVEDHLLDCSDCRVFYREVKNSASLPLQQAPRQPVPGELWDSIKQNIEQESQEKSPLENFINGLKGLITFPKMVPIFASFAVMFIIGSVSFNTIQTNRLQARDQGEYLVSLLSPTGSVTTLESSDLGTPIEHYFL